MPFVLDASITATWRFPDETDTCADAAMHRLVDDQAIVPALWCIEIRNILVVNERRGRIEPAESDVLLDELTRLPIRIDNNPDKSLVLSLARKHGLTSFDAAYLDIAVRLTAPMATLDRALARAVQAEQLPCLGV
ncbi:MAG: type II toxin-antitoxin system VapC family toxin [Alphaproteobacteria bacterium]|nr:type II toxin-antitoxin system VapC family toxin [Alphaproteobacteria bacterium]